MPELKVDGVLLEHTRVEKLRGAREWPTKKYPIFPFFNKTENVLPPQVPPFSKYVSQGRFW